MSESRNPEKLGTLYLIPVPIGDGDPRRELAPRVLEAIGGLRHFVVENERSARRFLSRVMEGPDLDASTFSVLDEHTRAEEVSALLEPLLAGSDAGLLSEAGSPCVADPGAVLVEAAHGRGIRSVPLPGPSSLLLALMASGLGGQRFSFSGYLPPDREGRAAALRRLETRSAREGSTEIFIETPYRNAAMVEGARASLRPDTVFCAAQGLSTPEERVIRLPVSGWRGVEPLAKVPTVFLLSATGDGRPREAASDSPRAKAPSPRAPASPGRGRRGPTGRRGA